MALVERDHAQMDAELRRVLRVLAKHGLDEEGACEQQLEGKQAEIGDEHLRVGDAARQEEAAARGHAKNGDGGGDTDIGENKV